MYKLYFVACDTNADIVFCGYDRIEEDTKRVLCEEMLNFPPKINLPSNDDILSFINGSLWNKLFKTSIIKNIRIPDFKVGEDLCFQQEIYTKCESLASINEVLIHYNVRKNSVISNTQELTIHKFASQFVLLYNKTEDDNLKSNIALTAFIHIGISMAIRAYDNPDINIKDHLKWTKEYFDKNFNLFSKNKLIKLSSLKHHGIKGIAIWICKVLYKYNCFRLFLWLYTKVVKISHKDFKF